MTPPGSGERRQGKSHLHVGKECGPSCPDSKGIEFKPDSGEREVCKVCLRKMARNSDWGQLVPDSLCWAGISKSLGAECWQLGYERHAALVGIDPPLAQRILAALDAFENLSLAAELRAVVERKT